MAKMEDEFKAEEMASVTRRIFGDTGIQVKYTQSKGRHVITNKDLKTADIVLTSDPFTIIANEVSIRNVCANCFVFRGSDEEHDTFCESCEEAWYCNDECKQNHFESLHIYECAAWKEVRTSVKSSDFAKAKLRSLVRLLVKRRLEIEAAEKAAGSGLPIPEVFGPKFVDVESLIAHKEENDDQAELNDILVSVRKILDVKYTKDLEDEFILTLMSRTECNQFGLWSPEDELLGLSLHPSASFFNHSCIPNCYSEWSGINLVFRTLYPIPAGTELCISYIDAHSSTRIRRQELRNAYYFTCICPRCSHSSRQFPREYYDSFYQRYLRCPKGPGLMRLDAYQGESDDTTTSEASNPPSQSATPSIIPATPATPATPDPENSNGTTTTSSSTTTMATSISDDATSASTGLANPGTYSPPNPLHSQEVSKKKKKKKKRITTFDGVELPSKVPYGYEIRSCMTCSTQRCSPCVPALDTYLQLYNVYEPVKYMEEPVD